MKIDIAFSTERLTKKLNDLEKRQLPFATSKALNATAQTIKAEIREAMPRVFDRPTPFTLNSLYLSAATKRNLFSEVWLKDFASKGTPAVKYLAPEVYGGTRRQKRSERALERAGFLPSGMFWTPGTGAKLDKYGNIPGGRITQILSTLKAFSEVGYMANITERSRKRNKKPRPFFVSRPASVRLPLGVYERYGSRQRKIRPVLMFVRQPMYRSRLPFFKIARVVYRREFNQQFARAWQEALASAR